MAVPKKRTSKSKKNLRKTVWKKKALKQAMSRYSQYLILNQTKKKGSELDQEKGFSNLNKTSSDISSANGENSNQS